jgi:hypothetical protein
MSDHPRSRRSSPTKCFALAGRTGADAFEVVPHRGAFRNASLLILPGIAANCTDEELVKAASGMVADYIGTAITATVAALEDRKSFSRRRALLA